MEFLHFPQGVLPGTIDVVSHPAHFLRLLCMMEKYKQNIPPGTVIQAFPVPTPRDGAMKYAENELLGTIAAIWRYQPPKASPLPHQYQL